MAEEIYFADDATLTVEDDASTPSSIAVGELKGVTIELTADHVTLFSGDSIERSAVKKREAEIPVEISVAAFDVQLMQGWLAGDSTATGTTSLTDTTDVAEYTITGEFTNIGGGSTVTVTVEGVYFETMPAFTADEGEFIVKDLSGTGSTVSDFSEA
jgi:hypothetical protein